MTWASAHVADVAIVGGGPAGAALAARLAGRGRQVVLFERLRKPRWRAAGVYSSPLTRRRLLALGLPAETVEQLIRPISAMVVRTADGRAACRLKYPDPHSSCGVDRVRLERALLDWARQAGAEVYEGAVVTRLDLGSDPAHLTVGMEEEPAKWKARLVVGADGPSSIVARAAGSSIPSRRFRRAALTLHHADPTARPPGAPMEAELIIGRGWYCGIAPVPGERVNVGLVLGEAELRRQLRQRGGREGIIGRVAAGFPPPARAWTAAPATDDLQVALPLAHRVRNAVGRNFVLVGDAAGFVDPISGEGLHRALATAEMATDAISAWLDGDAGALPHYAARLRARFGGKDMLSWLLQAFLVDQRLAGHALRNLDRRPELRRTFAAALADLAPPSTVLDPRYLARVSAP